MRNKLLAMLAVFTMFSAIEANAQVSQNINVQATVNPVCLIDDFATPVDFDFGLVDIATGANIDSTATFSWRCSTGTNVSIRLDVGTTSGSDPDNARLLVGPTGDTIEYLLCQDSNCGSPWGDDPTSNHLAETGQGMGTSVIETIFGRLFGATAQDVAPGIYTETVILSLVF